MAVFEACGAHIVEQMDNRNREIKQKINDKLAVWEAEMKALLSDFDHNLEQIAEIEDFNS